MIRVLAIDPGDRHTGMALLSPAGVSAWECDADQTLIRLKSWLVTRGDFEAEVVVESFKLYPGQDQRTTYKRMETSELIGAIKLLCSQYGTPVFEQDATIKKPTRRQLRARGIKQVGSGPHARDAELHMYYRHLRRDGQAS